jgi:2,4-dienoyl-CoA reductase-like NADH-dependent reductase (Old Yellow Enzyme family)
LGNRIVMPAMDMNLCDDGAITDGEIAHYRTRAAGGTAMVITGSGAVAFPVGAASRRQPGLSDDRFVPGLRRLSATVHEAGALLCVQLTHHGATARVDIAEGRPLFVPSTPNGRRDLSSLQDNTPEEIQRLIATTGGREPSYQEADEDDIAWLIFQFAESTRRVRAAGGDAVEVHAAHGYVLSTFLSRADNRRADRWGGSLENRARLTVEVLRAVRTAAGSDMAVLVRLPGLPVDERSVRRCGELGEPGRPAEPARGLDEGDAVAALGGQPGRPSSARPTERTRPDPGRCAALGHQRGTSDRRAR